MPRGVPKHLKPGYWCPGNTVEDSGHYPYAWLAEAPETPETGTPSLSRTDPDSLLSGPNSEEIKGGDKGTPALPRTDPDRPAIRAENRAETPKETAEYPRLANCPLCGAERELMEDVTHHIALNDAHGKQTGPKTPEGKAASAANGGHDNRENSRFNGIKHGQYIAATTVMKADCGRYSICQTCPVAEQCGAGYFEVCQHYQSTAVTYFKAIVEKNFDGIRAKAAAINAQESMILEAMIAQVIREGATVLEPAVTKGGDEIWVSDPKDPKAGPDSAKTIRLMTIKPHPLLSLIGAKMQALGLTMGDMLATPKSAGDQKAKSDVAGVLRDLLGLGGSEDETAPDEIDADQGHAFGGSR